MSSAKIHEFRQSMTSVHRVAKTVELDVPFTLLTSEPERCFQARRSSTFAKDKHVLSPAWEIGEKLDDLVTGSSRLS